MWKGGSTSSQHPSHNRVSLLLCAVVALLSTLSGGAEATPTKSNFHSGALPWKKLDTQLPSTPGGLALTGGSATSLSLSWSQSTDNVGVTGYIAYLNGSKVGTTKKTTYSFGGLSCATSYKLAVAAVDASGNRSGLASVTASTSPCASSAADRTAPSTPGGLTLGAAGATTLSLSWNASTDNVGVSGYALSVDGSTAGTTQATSYGYSNLTCGTSYSLSVAAFDAAGNLSPPAAVNASTSPCPSGGGGGGGSSPVDSQAPSVPTGLKVAGTTGTSISLTWTASTDNVGVTGYEVYRAATPAPVTTSSSTTASVTGLACGTGYSLAVDAVDAAGNRSGQASVSASTAACPATTTTPTTTTAATTAARPTTTTATTTAAKPTTTTPTTTSTPTTTTTPTTTAAPTTTTTPSAPSDGILTGTYWANTSDYAQLKSLGYGFSVTNVAPGDVAGAKAKLDAAAAAGIKLIIGLYSFGGPEPYTLNSDGTWTFTQGSIDVINYLKTRPNDVLAFFGMNEPYWTGPGGTNQCGVYSAANLRQFRSQIQAMAPGLKVYQDIGWPSAWAPGGDVWVSCVGQKYADQTGVADYVGIWAYPFTTSGYVPNDSANGLPRLQKESGYVINSMHATPVWLGQSFGGDGEGAVYPTDAQIKDWNCRMRAAMPAGALLSWYVWDNQYSDFLKNHPSQWPLTEASAC
jgi:chitodextrinase